MHALFSRRRFAVVGSSSSQLTKSLMMMKKKLAFSYPSQTRFVPCLVSRSEKAHGFFSTTLRNTHLKLESGNLLESRAGFFEPKPWVFTGFQKRGWKSWVNGANGVVFGLIIANAAVFTMWHVSDRDWMVRNFVLSLKSFMTGRIHTLITSGFSNIQTSQLIMNIIGLYYFGSSIARTLGPIYLLKLYFAGSLASSVLFLSAHAVWAKLKSQGFSGRDQSTVIAALLGPEGSVFAITLLDICLYPKVTTYFAFMCRVPVMLGIFFFASDVLKMLDGKSKSITMASIHVGGGALVAAIAWRQIRKGRFYH